MYPPIFALAFASAAVKALLGTNPLRFYQFGDAPQGVTKPYAVWQTITGSPENYLGNAPDVDRYTVQVDVYASSADSARACAEALRDAVEPAAHIVGWRGERRDPTTKNFNYSFDVEFHVKR